MKKLNLFIGFFICIVIAELQAQQLPILNHYVYNPYLYNPSRTGQDERGLVALHFKNQWTSMPNAPFTGALCLETPINSKKLGNMGLGGMLYVDKMHLTTNIGGMGTYAYHIPFEKGKDYTHGLSAGISLGFVHQRINYPGAIVENPNDNELLPSEGSGTSFDFSAGLDYEWKNLHVGISMLQGLNTGLRLIDKGQNDIKYINTRQWIILTSYKHTFGVPKKHRLYLEPVFMGRIIENIPFQAEGNIIVGLEKMGWLGIGYRSSNNTTATSAFEITMGLEIHQHFIFAYTFGIGVDANLNLNMGTQHEFMLAYSFGENHKIKKMQKDMVVMEEDSKLLKSDFENEKIKNSEKMDSMSNDMNINKAAISEANKNINSQNEKINQQADKIDKNEQKINSQDKLINKNEEEIEKLKEMMKNQPLSFKKIGEIFFDNGVSSLDESSKSNLDAVFQLLNEEKAKGNQIKVYIKGNSSTNGNAKKNMELSLKRATKVRQYLVNKGFNGSDITVIPMGEEDPTMGNSSSSSGDSKDRRVDIIFTQKKA